MKLDKEKAMQAMKEKIADPLGLDVIDAAWGIHRVITENMASAARIHVLEKGKDPRRFSLLAFGGAGPIHAWQTAKLVGSPRIISPLAAGVMSALGFLVTPVSNGLCADVHIRLDEWTGPGQTPCWTRWKRGVEQVVAGGVSPDEITVTRSADMRYVRQGREINVPIPNGKLSARAFKRSNNPFTRYIRNFIPGT